MSKQEYKWLPPTDHKPIEWDSIALIGFESDGWPRLICTVEPRAFLQTIRDLAKEEFAEIEDEDEDEYDMDEWNQPTCSDMEMAERSLRWALFPVDIAKEIFCSAREERERKKRKYEEPKEPPKPLPGQLTLPIANDD